MVIPRIYTVNLPSAVSYNASLRIFPSWIIAVYGVIMRVIVESEIILIPDWISLQELTQSIMRAENACASVFQLNVGRIAGRWCLQP